ncbi:response regulator, partial [Xanthomonas sp. Kuri4-2]
AAGMAGVASVATPPPATPMPLAREARILVVEDNPVNLLVAQKLLAVLGYAADAATDGEAALARMEAGRYDLVLMDCQMPVLDGYAATRRWRALEADTGSRPLPIVAMTANSMAGDRERCLAAGMDGYLSKPVSREQLDACLRHWLPRPLASSPAAAAPTAPVSHEPTAPEIVAQGAQAHGLPILDVSVLDELHEVAGAETARILQLFLEDAPTLIARLEAAAAAADPSQLREAAHTLKSSSANVGAMALSNTARRIELAARTSTLDRPAAMVGLVIAEYARARLALTDQIGRLQGPAGRR